MRSVVIKGVKALEVETREKLLPKEGYVLIEVLKAGICGSDIHYWDLGDPKGLVMGHEFCGIVLDNGGCERFNVGDRVTALPISPCMKCEECKKSDIQICAETWTYAVGLSLDNPGAFSERVLVREDMVRLLPDSINDKVGAMIEPAAVSYRAVNLSDVNEGDKVLVVGGGIIGLLCAMFAKSRGAGYVALTETNEARGEKAFKLGVCDEWFNALDENLNEKVMSKTENGFDVVFDCCGNSPALSSAIMFTKPDGNLILVGISMGLVNIPLVAGIMKEINIKGTIGYSAHDFDEVIRLASTNEINLEKFVDDVVSLEEVQEAFERLTSGNDSAVKILVDPKKYKILNLE